MKWSPSQLNGWYAKPSPSGQRYLYGFGEAHLALLDRDPVIEVCLAAQDAFTFGWLDETVALYCTGNQNDRLATLHRLTIRPDGTWTDEIDPTAPALVAGNWLDARDGHWISLLGGDVGRLTLDGVALPVTGHMAVAATAGGRVAWGCALAAPGEPEAWGIKLWDAGAVTPIRAQAPFHDLTLSPEGWIGYGRWGPAWVRDPDGEQFCVDDTPWHVESAPVVVFDGEGRPWIWTATEDPFDHRLLVLGRPFDDMACIIVADQPGIGLRVVWMSSGCWRVSGNDDKGRLLVQDVDALAARQIILDRRPPPPPPSVRIVSVEPVQAIVPFTTIAQAEILNADTHRWLLDGAIHYPAPDSNPHRFEIRTAGIQHEIGLRASGPGGITETKPHETWGVVGHRPLSVTRGFHAVQAGFGDPVAPERLVALKGFGWQTVRLQCHLTDPHATAAAARGALDAGLWPIVIIRGSVDLHYLPAECDLELFNEPDIGSELTTPRMTPQGYAWVVRNVYPYIGRRKLWVPALSNLGTRNLRWLRDMVAAGIPRDVGISVHWYPDYKRGVFGPPFSAICEVIQIADGREWAVTEFGFHVGTWTSGAWWWKRTRRLTEDEQAFYARNAFAVFHNLGAQFATWYQIGSGPNADEPLDNFGLQRHDGTWRPVARVPQA